MFGWLKKLFAAAPESSSPEASPPETERPLSVMDVVDAFLRQNPQRTPLGTLALIQAGATRLVDSEQVRDACERIATHGYQYPLSPTVQHELDKDQLLEFLRWQQAQGVGKDAYVNEHAVRGLIERFRAARSGG